jgi:ABC-type lipoprotein release transport system permease subunit
MTPVTRGSVMPVTFQDRSPTVVASAALYRQLGDDYLGYDGVAVKLRPGASQARFIAAARALTARFPGTGGQVFAADETVQAATIERSIRPQAVALALFAVALALCAILIVGQVAARVLRSATGDNGTLAALGASQGQLLATALAQLAAAAIAGAALAVVVAVLASPLTPIGPARLAEPSPGLAADPLVLGAGFAVIVAALLAWAARSAWRQASPRLDATRDRLAGRGGRPRIADQLARSGMPVTAVTGVHMALAPGRGRAPARGALAGLVVAVAAVAAATTFGASLARVVSTPGLYGQDWDVAVDVQFNTLTPGQFSQLTAGVPDVASVTFGTHSSVEIGQQMVPAIGLVPGRGTLLSATLLSGRAPRNAGEIVLGTTVLRQAGLHVGQQVTVTLDGGGHRRLQIVGSAVFPFFGQGSFTPTDVGLGAEAAASLLPAAIQVPGAPPGPAYNFALVRFAPGAGRSAAVARFTRALSGYCAQVQQSTCVVTDQRPNTVANYASIDATPAVLAGLLAVLGLGMLAQFILTTGAWARRDIAVLKVVGMLRRQVMAVTGWQASVIVTAALAVGLPLGIAGGHWAWAAFALAAGLPAATLTPLPVLWMIPAAVLAANLIAARPALVAARTHPAVVLRAE